MSTYYVIMTVCIRKSARFDNTVVTSGGHFVNRNVRKESNKMNVCQIYDIIR